ncbi:putative transmembrane protein [Rhodopirellula islandica]|uniref:Transmembrane protein n=1 Tax=Rhodopirellula islandica TaxID=595434 RepID=A0A0J1EEL4_RHOIS|nr:SMI1/KNR4 family protein [Rhodopirellula islandica]KLU03929.1 putative transmembrane protein [Rhodopirellula islandica]
MSDPLDDAETPSGPNASVQSGQSLDAAPKWSDQLQERFAVTLQPDLASWFDDEVWRSPGNGEFVVAVSPETLLKSVPDPVWPPLMPPNFLPLVGSHAGDWLCLRLSDGENAAGGAAYDLCHWYHGGGDWLPWGNSLAEALLFDQILPFLPASDHRHAIPSPMDNARSVQPGTNAWQDWMTRWLPEGVRPIAQEQRWQSEGTGWIDDLLNAGVCGVAIGCQLVIDELSNELTRHLMPADANRMGLAWNDIMRWGFDLRTLPVEIANRLQDEGAVQPGAMDPAQQNWSRIESLCERTHALAPELAWAAELLGYCRMQREDFSGAAVAFWASMRCSVFTDQSVRLRTHWATSGAEGMAKFGAYWMSHESKLRPESGDTSIDQSKAKPPANAVPASVSMSEYLDCLQNREGGSVRSRLTTFFLERADQNTASGQHAEAVRCLYAAGWDLGTEPMTLYADLLGRLVNLTQVAGWTSHEILARMHRDCFRKRYGT